MDVRQTQVEERASPRRRADTGPIHAKRFDADARGPLAGVRVVDLSRLMAGNMLSLQLADFGADVVKVENERGDTLRAVGAGGVSTNWKVYGRNKRSVCVDLRSADGIDIVKRLVRDADVFVESFKPGVLEQMGLGPNVLLELRPSLVIARISGWGRQARIGTSRASARWPRGTRASRRSTASPIASRCCRRCFSAT